MSDHEPALVQPPPAPTRPPPPDDTAPEGAVGLWHVYGAMLLCMAITGLLTSGRLVEIAERQPLGSLRRAALVGAASGAHALSQAVSADRPALWVDQTLGRSSPVSSGAAVFQGTGRTGGGASDGSGLPGIAAVPTGMYVLSTPRAWTYFPTPGPSPTPTSVPRRPVAPDAPLTVLVVGDSFAEPLGSELINFGMADGMVDVAIDARISTGIARPDYFDWPAQLAAVAVDAPPPEAVVLFMGANDDQNMTTEDGVVMLTTPEWRAEYRRRVGLIMDAFADRGILVYWVGLPVMLDPFEHQVAMDINDALIEEAHWRPWMRYVDIWNTFAGPDGGFAMYLPDAGGEMLRVRQNDGVHLTRTGSDQVAALVYDHLHRDWDLTPPTPTPEPPTVVPPEGPIATSRPPEP